MTRTDEQGARLTSLRGGRDRNGQSHGRAGSRIHPPTPTPLTQCPSSPTPDTRHATPPSAITAIEPQRRGRRLNVYVGGEFALALEPETLADSRLAVGSAVAENQLMELAAEDTRRRAFLIALRLLAYRPRTEQEIRTRLLRRGLAPDVVAAAIEKLRGYGYVDDAAFARFWVESRANGSPRGERLVRRELRSKGVAVETATAATADLEDGDAARQAAQKKARSLRGLDYPQFRNRLTGYLQRRGFGYDVIRPIIQEMWSAQGPSAPDDDADAWES